MQLFTFIDYIFEKRGYVGKSYSERAESAMENDILPKTKFKKKFGVDPTKYIDSSEWHHTGPNYQKTDFYDIEELYDFHLDNKDVKFPSKTMKAFDVVKKKRLELLKYKKQWQIDRDATIKRQKLEFETKEKKGKRLELLKSKFGEIGFESIKPNSNKVSFKGFVNSLLININLTDNNYKDFIKIVNDFINSNERVVFKGWQKEIELKLKKYINGRKNA